MSLDDDIDERRRSVALFRHQVIGELEAPMERGDLSARIHELAQQVHRTDYGRDRRISERTLWDWWARYKRDGLDGLVPAARKDRGVPVAMKPDILSAAIALRRELPSRSTSTLIDILVRQKRVPRGHVARSTLDRHLALAGFSRRRLKTLGDKRYIRLQFDRPNQFWIGDYKDAAILWDPQVERFREVHLCAFIDHFSKLVLHAQWYRSEDIATLEDTYKKAIIKRGVTDKVYVDGAMIYRSADFGFALAAFKTRRVISKPYTSEGRGGIERWNRTVAEQFVPEARAARITTLEELNLLFEAWLEERYHRERHGTTNEAPLDRFAAAAFKPRFPDPIAVQDTFRVRVRRKVHPKACTVEIAGVRFVVETFLRGRWVTVHYDPHRLDDVLVFLKRKKVQRAFPQKPNEPPQPRPETPPAGPLSFDYLAALRADYDRRLVTQVRQIRLSDFKPTDDFTKADFLALCRRMLGLKTLPLYVRDELERCFDTLAPMSEGTCRLALEHALKLRGRGFHVSVYTQYIKTFHLHALEQSNEEDMP